MNKIVVAILINLLSSIAIGAVKTNVNQVTDLFDSNIEDKDKFFQQLDGNKNNALAQIKSKEALANIEGIKGSDGKAKELQNIKATDLDSAGRKVRASKEFQFYDENEFEPDYTKPGNRLHKLDANKISQASSKTLKELLAKFSDIGVDCKTVKGPVAKEPTYYIDLKKEQQKNTEFDQFFCEELRNKYDCRDEVELTCKKKGKKYGDWQLREITYSGEDVHNNHFNWVQSVYWKMTGSGKSKYKGVINASAAPSIRDDIAAKLKVGVDQIEIVIPAPRKKFSFFDFNSVHSITEGIGGLMEWPRDRFRMAWAYPISYKFREGSEICAQWSEEWTERCLLK